MFSAERVDVKKYTKSCFLQKSAVNFGQKIVKNCEFFVKNCPFPADLRGILIIIQKIQKVAFPGFAWGMGDNFSNHFFRKIFLLNFFRLENLMFF